MTRLMHILEEEGDLASAWLLLLNYHPPTVKVIYNQPGVI